ncbi:AMIN-like domain-containing (lipo)protein [Myxococcus sp. Y35]|uniref:AMIN-like domain-containing (lipo)protein n=1 Tax=Pseudomyxococcus flavus TaxID=3115648 RepID=UPI003CF49CC4
MTLSGRRLTSLWLAGSLAVAGCSKKEEPAAAPTETQAPPQATGIPSTRPPEGTIPREGEAAARPPVHTATGVFADGAGGEAVPPTEAPAPDAPPDGVANREWTTEPVQLKRSTAQAVTLRSVRAGTHADFDRVVFEFDGPQVPGYQLQYVDKPIIQCGSGDETPVAGQAWLQVTLTPARGHDDQGRATVAALELKPRLPTLLELVRTCDFEAEVTWVLGTKARGEYRVMALRDPTRLVVDVKH